MDQKIKNQSEDSYGKGLLSYHGGNKKAKFKVWSNVAETEYWNVSVFFRSYEDMPELEKVALEKVKGTTLDVGAGAGNHALYLQQKGISVTALDLSEGAADVMNQRGVNQVKKFDFFTYFDGQKYDTILMLMNGIGIVGSVERLPKFFQKVDELLAEDGILLLDSSDLRYLFEDEDGSMMIDLNSNYYGELEYRMDFGPEKGTPFEWLFLDYDLLEVYAESSGFQVEKLYEDDHYLYLAKIERKK